MGTYAAVQGDAPAELRTSGEIEPYDRTGATEPWHPSDDRLPEYIRRVCARAARERVEGWTDGRFYGKTVVTADADAMRVTVHPETAGAIKQVPRERIERYAPERVRVRVPDATQTLHCTLSVQTGLSIDPDEPTPVA